MLQNPVRSMWQVLTTSERSRTVACIKHSMFLAKGKCCEFKQLKSKFPYVIFEDENNYMYPILLDRNLNVLCKHFCFILFKMPSPDVLRLQLVVLHCEPGWCVYLVPLLHCPLYIPWCHVHCADHEWRQLLHRCV